jgi:hypothetical protein
MPTDVIVQHAQASSIDGGNPLTLHPNGKTKETNAKNKSNLYGNELHCFLAGLIFRFFGRFAMRDNHLPMPENRQLTSCQIRHFGRVERVIQGDFLVRTSARLSLIVSRSGFLRMFECRMHSRSF